MKCYPTADEPRPDIYAPTTTECFACEHYHTFYECMATQDYDKPIWQCDVLHDHADATNVECTPSGPPPLPLMDL